MDTELLSSTVWLNISLSFWLLETWLSIQADRGTNLIILALILLVLSIGALALGET